MKIIILYNRISENPLLDELDVLEQIRSVTRAMLEHGHTITKLPFDLDMKAAKTTLLEQQPDIVFNLVESVDGKGSLLHFAPALLETLKIPYTGCRMDAIFLTSNKILAKKILAAAGLDTPDWITPTDDNINKNNQSVAGKWIIKSVWEHASLGIDSDSVIHAQNKAEILAAINTKIRRFGGDWFAERYIDGREFNIALLADSTGAEVLHPAEILFDNFEPGKPKIVDYRAKWDTDSFEYRHTVRSFDFSHSDKTLLEQLKTISRACWRAFNLQGYARVDFRVDADGQPWILEINANPCLSEDAGFAAAVTRTGYSYATAVQRIVEAAISPDETCFLPDPPTL